MKKIQLILGLLAGALCVVVPIYAFADTSFGDMAENLFAPTAFITRFIIFGSYVVGAGFLLAALMQYRIHRQTPKLVPLTTPVLLLLLGIFLLMLPYISTHSGASWSAVEVEKKQGSKDFVVGPALPDIERPGMKQQPSNTPSLPPPTVAPQSPPPSAPHGSTGRHWSDSPDYK